MRCLGAAGITLTIECKELVRRLLHKDADHRLGNLAGALGLYLGVLLVQYKPHCLWSLH